MRYVALGDLVIDCYYRSTEQGKKLIKVDGGCSRFNVIANLAFRKNETAVISGYGNGISGIFAIRGLELLGVDISKTIKKGKTTRTYHLIIEGDKHISTKICPVCGTRTWYETPIISIEECLTNVKKEDILILDGLRSEDIKVLKGSENEKVMDIGRIKRLESLSNEEILGCISDRNIQILQLNETVEKYLIERFKLKDMTGIYKLFYPNFLIVTRGKGGADFISDNKFYHKELNFYKKEIDDTGAGDAFFSMFIQRYFDNNKKVDEKFIDSTFELANELTAKVVTCLGARGHLYNGCYLKDIDNCICN